MSDKAQRMEYRIVYTKRYAFMVLEGEVWLRDAQVLIDEFISLYHELKEVGYELSGIDMGDCKTVNSPVVAALFILAKRMEETDLHLCMRSEVLLKMARSSGLDGFVTVVPSREEAVASLEAA